MSDTVTIEYQGKSFSGYRLVESSKINGSPRLFQTIYYGSRSKFDGHPYRSGEDAYMRLTAEIILGELVRETGNQ